MKTPKLNIVSIFPSIDGEANGAGQGALTVFIRFAGCNLRCQYPCDTEYSFDVENSKQMTITEIINEVEKYGLKKITITGGEPLLQFNELLLLVEKLKWYHYDISIETNGSIIWFTLLGNINSIIVDYKLPSSGMMERMLPIFYFQDFLDRSDWIKFVILDRNDFQTALQIYEKIIQNNSACRFAFSPVHNKLEPQTLLTWMLEAKLRRSNLNLQLHKILNLKEDK